MFMKQNHYHLTQVITLFICRFPRWNFVPGLGNIFIKISSDQQDKVIIFCTWISAHMFIHRQNNFSNTLLTEQTDSDTHRVKLAAVVPRIERNSNLNT